MPHSKAAKASVEAATADPAAVPAAHPRGESRLPFSVKPTAKPTINPEDKTAASTAKCVGTVKVVAPPLSPRARLTARRSPPGSAAPPRTNFLIHTRSSLICWSLCGNQEVSRGHFDLSALLGAETGPRPRRASPPAPARPAPTAARPRQPTSPPLRAPPRPRPARRRL